MKARVVCFQKTEHSDLNFIVRKIYNVICTHWENLPLFLFCLFLHFSFCTINSGFSICGKGRDIRASPQSLNFLFCFLFLDSEITAGGTIHTHSKHTYNHIQHTTTGVENEFKKNNTRFSRCKSSSKIFQEIISYSALLLRVLRHDGISQRPKETQYLTLVIRTEPESLL